MTFPDRFISPDPFIWSSMTEPEIAQEASERGLNVECALEFVRATIPVWHEAVELPTGEYEIPRYDTVRVWQLLDGMAG